MKRVVTAAVLAAVLAPVAAAAGEVSAGDTAWLLTSTAMVMLMTAPGLALFYGGLVSHRNVLATVTHAFLILSVISVQWVLLGYTLSFGGDVGGLVGGLDFALFDGVGQEAASAGAVPHVAFAMYQCVFAIITVALITGAFAERMRIPAFLAFSVLWATFVYDPLAHWVWGGGWLMQLGALDFAGGTVVHVSSGVSALVAVCVLGPRSDYPGRSNAPHSAILTVIGAGLLWFGWFGFNAGSALASGGLAAMAFATTNTAAAAGALSWVAAEWFYRKKPTAVGTVTGAVAGLVAITPAAGFVTVGASLLIGLVAGLVCYAGVAFLKPRLGYDDSLDVFGVHGIGGAWGAIATGIFATTSINPAGRDGLLAGNPEQLFLQAVALLACASVAGAATWVILKLVAAVTPLRVTEADEAVGLDLSLHGEVAYGFLDQAEAPMAVRREAPAMAARAAG
jgi:Amt family ammonium transporter